jgi:flagellar basal-body rod protein FlgB
MWDQMFGSVDLLQKGVEASWLRNSVITNNIANADTVGFKSSEVEFEDLFAQSIQNSQAGGLKMTTTDEKHFAVGGQKSGDADAEPVVVRQDDTSLRYDENNVDVEGEMTALAKNSIEYYTLVSKVNSEFHKLDAAINVT